MLGTRPKTFSLALLTRLLKGRRKKVLLATKLLGQMKLYDDATGGLSARWIKKALESAVKAGKVRVLGCSNFSGEQLASAGGRLAFGQVQYSLVARFHENDLVPVAQRDGVSLLAWSPLAGGLLSGKYASAGASGRRADADAFLHVEPQRGAALAWIMGKPFVASAVLGARTPAQLTELWDSKPLSPRAAALLDRASEICSRP